MSSWVLAGAGGAACAALVWAKQRLGWHQRALRRVPEVAVEPAPRRLDVGGLTRTWEQVLPWALGATGFLGFFVLLRFGPIFSGAVGVLGFVLGHLVASMGVGKRMLALEVELAEALDHIVTSLHAGVGVLDAIGSAEHHARRHLKPTLAALVARIRLGDDPVAVCKDLAHRLPLESFRLFFYALAVQWEGGGNLAPTLATTGRFIRDRVEVGRRVRAHTSEARFSVIAIIGLTYFLALLMWHLGADRVEGFLSTGIGQTAAAVAIVMQGLGAAWIARMSKIRF